MGSLTGSLGPALAEIRADASQAMSIQGSLVHGLHPELSWRFTLWVGADGRVQGHYGGRLTGQQIVGSLEEDACYLHVGGHVVGETVALRQHGNRIDGQVRGHVRSWDVHCLVDGTHIRGYYGAGMRRQKIDIEAVDITPLLAAGLMCVACHHFTVDYQSTADN